MELSRLMTQSTKAQPWGGKSARILGAALSAVDPKTAVLNSLLRKNYQLEVDQEIYNLVEYDRVIIIGAGKAGQPMAEAVQQVLGDKIDIGLIIVKEGYKSTYFLLKGIKIIE